MPSSKKILLFVVQREKPILNIGSWQQLQRAHEEQLHVVVRDSLKQLLWQELPHVYVNGDDIIRSTLPLQLEEETVLQGVLSYLRGGLDSRRIQCGISQMNVQKHALGDLQCPYTTRGHGVSKATERHRCILPIIHGLAKLRPVVSGADSAECRYMSISVNQGSVGWHRDLRNRGWSWSVSLGRYKGGNLLVKKGGNVNTKFSRLIVVFAGPSPCYKLYTPRDVRILTQKHISELHALGFPVAGMMDCLVIPDKAETSVLAVKKPRLTVDYDPERFYADTPPDSPREQTQGVEDAELPNAASPVTYGPDLIPLGFRDSTAHVEEGGEFAFPGVVHEQLSGLENIEEN
eukprot:4970612-Amphidinium_carterae.1